MKEDTSKPVIGISTYGTNEDNEFHLPATYVHSVREAGGVPILLPPGEGSPEVILALVDGIILAGGGDIAPGLYGAASHPTIHMVDDERDHFELELARQVMDEGTPTLGICRGAQVLAVAAGSGLVVDVPDEIGGQVVHRAPVEMIDHEVIVEAHSRLAEILGVTTLTVPSRHHQTPREVPGGWRLAACAPDGVIEAMEHESHPYLIAVQWHPERAPDDERHRRLFESLVSAARARRTARSV